MRRQGSIVTVDLEALTCEKERKTSADATVAVLCPRQTVRHAQDRRHRRQCKPKIKNYKTHQTTKYIPRYIAGGGPIKQQ